jgi:CRISPR-associated endonuclease Cas1
MSNLSKNARYAVDPINAILNYLYQLLYVEATLTLRTIGLDPRIGVFHVEIIGRNSLACDIMEAVRPEVDRWVLTYLRERVFSSAEFFETREGQCRLMPDVAGDLVRTMPEWSEACWKVAKPVYEQLVGKRVRRRG